jgi:hypothetical protein
MRSMPRGFVETETRRSTCTRPRPDLHRGALPFLLAALILPVHLGTAAATVCHPAAVPGATLLLPYFEVDLDHPNGLTTLFSISNASATAVLAHVALWSDLAVPVLNFNVYLTGYDVQTVNLRDIVIYGRLPQTASAGQDPDDTLSPKGLFSQDINFASCQGQLPPQPLTAAVVTHLQRALTGQPSPAFDNLCAGQALGDNIIRGYITVDTVNNCTVRFPGDDGYFAASNADVTDQNVLWGTWTIVNATQGFAEGSDMVAIEADGTDPATSTPGKYTFYGRYDGWSAVDHRSPLGTTFLAQFANGGPFNGGTDLLIWRDTKAAQAPFVCPHGFVNTLPEWFPLGQEGFLLFDEQEHAQGPPTCPFAAPGQPSATPSATPSECPPVPLETPAPAATQRIRVGGANLPVPFTFGWVYFDLNWANPFLTDRNPPADPQAEQAWVVAAESSSAHFAVARDAYRLDSACSANHFAP